MKLALLSFSGTLTQVVSRWTPSFQELKRPSVRVCEVMATGAGMLEEVVNQLKPTDVDVSRVTHFVLNWIIYNYKIIN